MEEDFDFEEMVAKLMVEAKRKMARQEAAQQAVGRVVGRAGRFNRDNVPKFLEAYNEEMDAWGVGGALRLEYFCRVVAEPIRAEVKGLREAHESWESFEGALMEAYGHAEPEGRGRREFDRWVASARRHRNVMDAFREFERRFSQLSEWEQRSGFVALRGTNPSASSRPFLLHQNLIVLARGFYEAGLLLDRVTPLGHLLDTLLCAGRLFLPQPYTGEALQHRWPEPGVIRLPTLFASYPDSCRSRVVDGLRMTRGRLLHQAFHSALPDVELQHLPGLAVVYPPIAQVHNFGPERLRKVPAVLPGMADRVAPQAHEFPCDTAPTEIRLHTHA
jgi:hypothetical protein